MEAFVLCACKVLALRGSTGLARDIYLSLLKHIYTAHTYCTVVAIVTTTAHALIMHPSRIIAIYRRRNMSIINSHCVCKQFDTCTIPENMQTTDLQTLSLYRAHCFLQLHWTFGAESSIWMYFLRHWDVSKILYQLFFWCQNPFQSMFSFLKAVGYICV